MCGYSVGLLSRVVADAVLYHDNDERRPNASAAMNQAQAPVNLDDEGVSPYRTIAFERFLSFLRWDAKLRVENKLRYTQADTPRDKTQSTRIDKTHTCAIE